MAAAIISTIWSCSASSVRSTLFRLAGIFSSQSAIKGGNGFEDVAAPRVLSGRFGIERLEKLGETSFENRITFAACVTSALTFRTGTSQ